jgi:hypothetical protein
MGNISFDILVNGLFGGFAISGASLVLFYRKNFTFYKGTAILLFAVGISSCCVALLSSSQPRVVYALYALSTAMVPIFILLFSEYVLKVKYPVLIKLIILSSTWFFVIASFFQKSKDTLYATASQLFYLGVLCTVIIYLIIGFVSTREPLLKKYILIYFITLIIVIINEILLETTQYSYNSYAIGISSFVVTHGVILIITSGGYSRIKQKLPMLLSIPLFSVVVCALLKLFHTEIEWQYLYTLFVLCMGILSLYYLVGVVSKNQKRIGSALLISRLLSLPLHDKEQFLAALRQWEEIEGLHYIDHRQVEGNFSALAVLFNKTNRAIHKYQMPVLAKTIGLSFIEGIEIAQFYFKKFDCHSLFQISEAGDFIVVKYMKGLNPALYENELSIMTKIVFSASNGSKSINHGST